MPSTRAQRPNYVTSLSRNKHSLRTLSFVMNHLTNVQHSLYKAYYQGIVMIRYHVFIQCFQLFGLFIFMKRIEQAIVTP